MKFSKQLGFGVVLLLLASGFLLAQDIPLNNWTVPPYTQSSHSGGITTMTDVTSPRLFVGITPCRVADTRGNGAPITGGIFANSEQRNWDVTGICGIPGGADAISVNFTVVSTAATPQGAFLLAWPTGSPPLPGNPTAVMTFGPGVTILSNAAIVPLAGGELLTVNVSHSTHIIMDVNGYFSDTLNTPQNFLTLTNNSTLVTIASTNQSTTCSGSCGIQSIVSSGHALFGRSDETTADVNYGVYGEANSSGAGSAGVRGFSDNPAGITYGVYGNNDSGANNSAGVRGTTGAVAPAPVSWQNAGVRGEGGVDTYGVLGLSRSYGVQGVLVNATGNQLAQGYLGRLGGDAAGCGGILQPACPTDWAVYAFGDFGATGLKFFLDPHPTDAGKVIGYISLEGPEAGTYFRGRGKFENGMAKIAVPEHFRMVTDAEGLTVQITPIGGMATVGVMKMDLNEIVVQSSRNLEFSFLVQGVRATFKDTPTVWAGNDFRPLSADAKIPAALSEGQRARLIANGTYKPDGTVNTETAHRLGWDAIWERNKMRPAPRPVETP
jgi:hypothetical protein